MTFKVGDRVIHKFDRLRGKLALGVGQIEATLVSQLTDDKTTQLCVVRWLNRDDWTGNIYSSADLEIIPDGLEKDKEGRMKFKTGDRIRFGRDDDRGTIVGLSPSSYPPIYVIQPDMAPNGMCFCREADMRPMEDGLDRAVGKLK